MRVLLHQLSDISYQWKLIGIDLEVNQNILKGLQQKTIDDMLKLSDVLQAWFDKNEEITWEKIIEVVEGRIIDNKTLADKIKQFLEN
jgi:ribosome-interacting GTPase 1